MDRTGPQQTVHHGDDEMVELCQVPYHPVNKAHTCSLSKSGWLDTVKGT